MKVMVTCRPEQSYGSTLSAVTINCISRYLAELPILLGERLTKIS